MQARRHRIVARLLAIALLAAACGADPHWYFADAHHEHHADWSYEGDTGPEHWGDLDPAYRLARTGRSQSPIDIRPASALSGPPSRTRFRYTPEPATYLNNGHTLQHDQTPGSWLEIDGKHYALKQFHFHTPSEHSIDGALLDAEIHLVHQGASGETAVVAILVRSGETNRAFASVHGTLPREGRTKTLTGRIDPAELLPESHRLFRYTGSFTTPPCSEDVEWLVLEQPIEAGAAEIEELRTLLGSNNRPIQPLHGRKVRVVEP
jgi:carbonic anhydrase